MLVTTGDAVAASDQTSFTKLTDHPLNQHQKRNTTIIAKSQVAKFYLIYSFTCIAISLEQYTIHA